MLKTRIDLGNSMAPSNVNNGHIIGVPEGGGGGGGGRGREKRWEDGEGGGKKRKGQRIYLKKKERSQTAQTYISIH